MVKNHSSWPLRIRDTWVQHIPALYKFTGGVEPLLYVSVADHKVKVCTLDTSQNKCSTKLLKPVPRIAIAPCSSGSSLFAGKHCFLRLSQEWHINLLRHDSIIPSPQSRVKRYKWDRKSDIPHQEDGIAIPGEVGSGCPSQWRHTRCICIYKTLLIENGARLRKRPSPSRF